MKLFEPITIRNLTLKNRIVMAPMGLPFGLDDRRASSYYAERAAGGVGAIITGAISPNLFAFDGIWGRSGGAREFIENLRPLVKKVHDNDARIGVQLCYSSRWPDKGPGSNEGEAVGPSARIEGFPPTTAGMLQPGDRVREISAEEIETIVDRSGKAAAGIKEAGFDFVELHLTHSYFACQFFSPFFNRRQDKYGGSLNGRMRFGLECIEAMRKHTGADFPLFCRLGVLDMTPGGINLQDSLEFACELVKAGVDVLDVDPAMSIPYATPDSSAPMGTFAYLAEIVKHRVKVPVITVGRINRPGVAESILQRGQADMVAIGRQLIADPFWPDKVKEGRLEEIVPCLSCNMCTSPGKYFCSVNAAAMREDRFKINIIEQPKKVWVIGGGPGGMEAARVAALRGNQVTLFERSDRLGGSLRLAATLPGKNIISEFSEYLARQVKKAGVECRLNANVNSKAILEAKPDVVVLATGSLPFVPEIPGIHGNNVVLAVEVLRGRSAVVGPAVVIGGELVACDVALFLSEQGKRVTMVKRGPVIAANLTPASRKPLYDKLSARGVVMLTGVSYQDINEKGLNIIDNQGNKRTIEAGTIILAAGARPDDSLAKELEGKVPALYSIGDCVEPRRIRDAIGEGARTALKL